MTTIFFRLLHADDKEAALRSAVDAANAGEAAADVFHVDRASFGQVPGSPFAYWVSEQVRSLFKALPQFDSKGRSVKQGLVTTDDFRFVRIWTEVAFAQRLRGWEGATAVDYRLVLQRYIAYCQLARIFGSSDKCVLCQVDRVNA